MLKNYLIAAYLSGISRSSFESRCKRAKISVTNMDIPEIYICSPLTAVGKRGLVYQDQEKKVMEIDVKTREKVVFDSKSKPQGVLALSSWGDFIISSDIDASFCLISRDKEMITKRMTQALH